MPRRMRDDAPQTVHHVIQRGNNRSYIYEDTRDKREFLSILSTAIASYGAVLLQYALMDNHYHLLIQMGSQPLSLIIWYLNRKYTLYYNKRYNRIGTIYGGRYKSYIIVERQKLMSTVRYIIRNPVKAGLAVTPAQYRWSGHASVLNNEAGMIDRSALLGYFAPDVATALKHYVECTEHEAWTAQTGFATIVDRKIETEERLGCLLDALLAERTYENLRIMIVSGAKSPMSRELRRIFVLIAIKDGHALKDIAAFLHVSHETVRRIGQEY